MRNFIWVLLACSGLSFVIAVFSVLMRWQGIAGIAAEGFSNGCTNLALIAIALLLLSKKNGDGI